MTHTLIARIEKTLNRKLVTKGDFEYLHEQINNRLGESISSTTLRRLWGYSNEGVTPSQFTLDVLARFLLYRDYADFCQNANNDEPQSGLCLGKKVESGLLSIGDRLRMSWQPDRMCLLKHLGEGRFVIEEALNTKLSVGDTFVCHLFINNEPAYLDNLFHKGQGSLRYVAGKTSGVLVELILQS